MAQGAGVHGAGVRGHVAGLLLKRARVVGTGPFVDVIIDVTIDVTVVVVVAVVTTRRYHGDGASNWIRYRFHMGDGTAVIDSRQIIREVRKDKKM